YFPFTVDNMDPLVNGFEGIFDILIETPPRITEAIERIKYLIINYSNGNKSNDGKVKNSVILCIADICKKRPVDELHPMLDYLKEKIVIHISSPYLREQALTTLFIASLHVSHLELSKSIIIEIFQGIRGYTETYAIMQGLKGTVKSIKRAGFTLHEDLSTVFKDEFNYYIIDENQPVELNTGNKLQIIELLEDLHLIEGAMKLAQHLLDNSSQEDMYLEQIRTKLSELRKTPL
ncbi:MAG: hypothetical protein ACTSWW_02160, partial [Promethearchaeota archaeon]